MFNGTTKENGNGKALKGQAGSPAINLIGQGTSIMGDITSEGDIRIDGRIRGLVTSGAKVVIGNTGEVAGNITSANADISGKVRGKLVIREMLILKATAVIEGDIITDKLVIEAGARFNGNCSMGTKTMAHDEKSGTPTLRREAI